MKMKIWKYILILLIVFGSLVGVAQAEETKVFEIGYYKSATTTARDGWDSACSFATETSNSDLTADAFCKCRGYDYAAECYYHSSVGSASNPRIHWTADTICTDTPSSSKQTFAGGAISKIKCAKEPDPAGSCQGTLACPDRSGDACNNIPGCYEYEDVCLEKNDCEDFTYEECIATEQYGCSWSGTTPYPDCGDNVCNGLETCSTCPEDCKCGDGTACDNSGECISTSTDPFCGDGVCTAGEDYEENFETCQRDCSKALYEYSEDTAGWTVIPNWKFVSTTDVSGYNSLSAWCNTLTEVCDGRYASSSDDTLTSPLLSLAGESDLLLTFKSKFYVEGEKYDNVHVRVSSDNGANWHELGIYPGYGPDCDEYSCWDGTLKQSSNWPDASEGWVSFEYPIPNNYLSDNFRIQFKFVSDGGTEYDGVRVDEIKVISKLEGSSTPPSINIEISPGGEIDRGANVQISVKITDTTELPEKAYILYGKGHTPAGRLEQYSLTPGKMNCRMENAVSSDYYAVPGCDNQDGCPCVINSEIDDANAPLMSVYLKNQFSEVSLTNGAVSFDSDTYFFKDCNRLGAVEAICPVIVYYSSGGVVYEAVKNVEILSTPGKEPEIVRADIVNEATNTITFDASASKYNTISDATTYLDDNENNPILEYKWYLGINDGKWGSIETDGFGKKCVKSESEWCRDEYNIETAPDGYKCDDNDCSKDRACSCAGEEIYTGFTSTQPAFDYIFSDDSCGSDGVCSAYLTVTDKNSLQSATEFFAVDLNDEYSIVDTEYGANSEVCTDASGDPISDTGQCCKHGYHINPEVDISTYMFSSGEEICVEDANTAPAVKIKSPDDDSSHKINEKIYFNMETSDADGTVAAYLWDFGDRSEPWGYLVEDEYQDIICEEEDGSDSCPATEAYTLEDYDEDEEVPCACKTKSSKYSDELLNIYPNSASTEKKATHEYESRYACTEFGDSSTTECKVTAWAFDEDGGSRKTSITIKLKSGADAEDSETGLYCGDGIVNLDEECDAGNASACASGVCASDCTCVPAGSPELSVPDTSSEAVCGNSRCEFGENAVTCLTDCHCGDGKCQDSLETKKTCPSDCKSTSTTLILLVIILASAGILFFLWKQGFDFSKFLPTNSLFRKFTGNAPEEPAVGGISPANPESKLEEYIQRTRRRGHSYTQIKEALENKGWSEDKINRAFSRAGLP